MYAWLLVGAVSAFGHSAFAQVTDQRRERLRVDEEKPAAEQNDAAGLRMLRITRVADPVSESVGRRYGLDEAAVDGLRQSLRASLVSLIEDVSRREEFVAAMERTADGGPNAALLGLLSLPAVATALGEPLTDEQLLDYMGSYQARQRRDRQTAHGHVMVWAEDHLSLTPDQLARVGQLLDAFADDKGRVSAKSMVWNQEIHGLLRGAIEASADDLLSEAQLVIWRALFPHETAVREKVIDGLREKIIAMARAGEMTREQAAQRLEAMEAEPGGDHQEAARRTTEARLAAHMEGLGQLDAAARGRLTLVAKGVVEQHLEGLHSAGEERVRAAAAEMAGAVERGEMTREQLEERLRGLREQIHAEQRATPGDVTEHPFYQQTIKEVLSEEAFAQYEERQEQRRAAREQASRDLAVACLDSHVLLEDDQRQSVEAAAAKLPVPTDTYGAPAAPFVLYDLAKRIERELLSAWQQRQLRGMGRELGFDRIERMRRGGDR